MRKKWILTLLLALVLGGCLMIFSIGKPASVKTDLSLEKVPSDIEEALYLASFAANSHNSQSWKMTLSPSTKSMNIFLDKERQLIVVDPENRELYISLGCYLESLQTAFASFGYGTEIKYINPKKENGYQVAEISYQKQGNSKRNQKQIDIIKQRHTDKRQYLSKELDTSVVKDFKDSYSNLIYYEKGTDAYNLLKNSSINAQIEQNKDPEFLKEQDQWLRFSNKEAEDKKDGITGDMLGLNPILKSLYYLTTNHQNSSSQTFVKQSISTLENQVNNASGFFVITGEQTIESWIKVGRETQKIWYECVENRIAVQPISASIEVRSYKEKLQKELGLDSDIQMILRVGYVDKYGENTSPRRDLADYIDITE